MTVMSFHHILHVTKNRMPFFSSFINRNLKDVLDIFIVFLLWNFKLLVCAEFCLFSLEIRVSVVHSINKAPNKKPY